jgi:hypothetical protein
MMATLIVISLLISACVLHGIGRYYRAAKSSEQWACVSGRLLKCELMERQGGARELFSLDVQYSYNVDGEEHQASRVMFYFPEWSMCRAYYSDLKKALEGSGALNVYVNPDNPKEAVLIPGPGGLPIRWLAVACAMAVVCPVSGALAVYLLMFR